MFIKFLKDSTWKWGILFNLGITTYSYYIEEYTGCLLSLAPLTLMTIGMIRHYYQVKDLYK